MGLKNGLTIFFGKMMVKILRLIGKDAGNAPGLVLWTLASRRQRGRRHGAHCGDPRRISVRR